MKRKTWTKASDTYKARVVAYGRAHPDLIINDILDAVPLEPGDIRPSYWTARNWLRAPQKPKPKPAPDPFWSEAQQAEARRLVMDERWAISRVVKHFHATYGHKPRHATVRSFLPDGHVYDPRYKPKVVRERWSDEVQALAVRLVVADGLSPSGASKRIYRDCGSGPGVHIISRWVRGMYIPKPVQVQSVAPSPVEHDEQPGDTWQTAWDAADALPDGTPQWVRDQVMLSAWIPEMQMGPDETYRSLRSGIKKTKRIKRGFDGTQDIDPELLDAAPGRRLAA